MTKPASQQRNTVAINLRIAIAVDKGMIQKLAAATGISQREAIKWARQEYEDVLRDYASYHTFAREHESEAIEFVHTDDIGDDPDHSMYKEL